MISSRFSRSLSSRLTLACTRCAATVVAAAAVVAGEVAVAAVVAVVVVVVGLVATATLSATAAGKRNDTFDDTTPGNGFPLDSAFDVDHFLFPVTFYRLQRSRCYALSKHTDTPEGRSILTIMHGH